VSDMSDDVRRLLFQLTSGTPCRLDHHGYCQEHDWFEAEECPEARALRVLDGWEPES